MSVFRATEICSPLRTTFLLATTDGSWSSIARAIQGGFQLLSSVEGVAWSRDGSEVWFTASPGGAARALYAMNMAGKERLVLRVPGTLSVQDITRDGRVLLTEDNPQIMMMALPPGEKNEKNFSWFDWSLLADISPDGKTLIFDESGEAVGARYGSFLRKTDGSPAVRLGDGAFSSLSPDGKWVASLEVGSPIQIQLLPTGAGHPRRLTNDALEHTSVRLGSGWQWPYFCCRRAESPATQLLDGLERKEPGTDPRRHHRNFRDT